MLRLTEQGQFKHHRYEQRMFGEVGHRGIERRGEQVDLPPIIGKRGQEGVVVLQAEQHLAIDPARSCQQEMEESSREIGVLGKHDFPGGILFKDIGKDRTFQVYLIHPPGCRITFAKHREPHRRKKRTVAFVVKIAGRKDDQAASVSDIPRQLLRKAGGDLFQTVEQDDRVTLQGRIINPLFLDIGEDER